jgi:hypothetical protein
MRDLRIAPFFQVDQHDHVAVFRRERVERQRERLGERFRHQLPLRSRPGIDDLERADRFFVSPSGIQRLHADAHAAGAVEERVAHDPKNPPVKVRSLLEAVERLTGFQQALLHQVFRVLTVPRQPARIAVEALLTVSHQPLKPLGVTQPQRPGFTPLAREDHALCFIGHHLRSTPFVTTAPADDRSLGHGPTRRVQEKEMPSQDSHKGMTRFAQRGVSRPARPPGELFPVPGALYEVGEATSLLQSPLACVVNCKSRRRDSLESDPRW